MDENNDSLLEDPVEIDFDELIRETSFAVHIRVAGIKMWLPKKEVVMGLTRKVVIMPGWMAIEKGLL